MSKHNAIELRGEEKSVAPLPQTPKPQYSLHPRLNAVQGRWQVKALA